MKRNLHSYLKLGAILVAVIALISAGWQCPAGATHLRIANLPAVKLKMYSKSSGGLQRGGSSLGVFDATVPFSCSNLAYQVAAPTGGTASTLYSFNVATGVRTALFTMTGRLVNSLVYNHLDNFFYATVNGSNKIIKIDANGGISEYTIANLPDPTSNYNVGAITPQGFMYIASTDKKTFYVVDLHPTNANYMKLVEASNTSTLDASPFGTSLSVAAGLSMHDWAFDSGTSKLITILAPVTGGSNNPNKFKIGSIDPATGVVTISANAVTGSTIQDETNAFGAVFSDNTGFYAFANDLGNFYKIDLATSKASFISHVNPSVSNDGARCISSNVALAATINVSGKVWNDNNANLSIDGAEVGTNVSGALHVNLVNSSGTILTSATVASDGTYTLTNVLANTTGLKIVLATNETAVVPGLPTGWSNTGENVGSGNTASQTATLGQIELTTVTTDIPNQNFGIRNPSFPVNLVSFKARKENQSVLLTWATTEETNSERFEVERRSTGKNWMTLISIPAAGESSSEIGYQWTDQQPVNSNLYRLKMIDTDGSFAYSSITSANFEVSTEVKYYPNPVGQVVKLQLMGIMYKDLSEVKFTSIDGRPVVSNTEITNDGINVSKLENGVYFMQITLKSGEHFRHKMVISR